MNAGGVTPLELRLRRALAGTSEALRPLADLELPPELAGFVGDDAVARLRAAAVLIPLVNRPAGVQVVLTRRADHLRKHGGQISFPGGARDAADASAAAAALRESQEEIGLAPARVELLGYLDDYPTGTGFRITPVVGWIEQPGALQPAEAEVAEVFEVPLSVVLDPGQYVRKTFERNGLILPYYELRHAEYRIWGATAGILLNLCQRVATYA